MQADLHLLNTKLGSPCTQRPLLQTQYFLLHNTRLITLTKTE